MRLISTGVAQHSVMALMALWKIEMGDGRGLRAQGNQSSILKMISLRWVLDFQAELSRRSLVIGFMSLEPKGKVVEGGRKFTFIPI